MIIERNEEEYLQEIKLLYSSKIKPLLINGYSLTKALNMVGITTGKGRKREEIRKLVLKDGYVMRWRRGL